MIDLRNVTKHQHMIEVRDKVTKVTNETINRKIYVQQCGNFSPLYCRYHNEYYLIDSEECDMSDPFRRDENMTLFIEV